MHTLPLQQPLEQEFWSQTHWPVVLSHSRPVPHGAQAAPPVPQERLPSLAYGSQVPAAVQHPFGQEIALQPHTPPMQTWPDGHEPPAPHVQTPLVHALAFVPHCPHVAPFCPQSDVFCDA